MYRHAAEAVDLAAGYQVLASPGAHAATFARASAVLGDASDVFGTVNATTMTGTRNKLEYLDADQSTEVDENDARWAAQLAGRATDGGAVEVADLGNALIIVPAGRSGLRGLVGAAIEEAGGYASLAARVGDEDPDLA